LKATAAMFTPSIASSSLGASTTWDAGLTSRAPWRSPPTLAVLSAAAAAALEAAAARTRSAPEPPDGELQHVRRDEPAQQPDAELRSTAAPEAAPAAAPDAHVGAPELAPMTAPAVVPTASEVAPAVAAVMTLAASAVAAAVAPAEVPEAVPAAVPDALVAGAEATPTAAPVVVPTRAPEEAPAEAAIMASAASAEAAALAPTAAPEAALAAVPVEMVAADATVTYLAPAAEVATIALAAAPEATLAEVTVALVAIPELATAAAPAEAASSSHGLAPLARTEVVAASVERAFAPPPPGWGLARRPSDVLRLEVRAMATTQAGPAPATTILEEAVPTEAAAMTPVASAVVAAVASEALPGVAQAAVPEAPVAGPVLPTAASAVAPNAASDGEDPVVMPVDGQSLRFEIQEASGKAGAQSFRALADMSQMVGRYFHNGLQCAFRQAAVQDGIRMFQVCIDANNEVVWVAGPHRPRPRARRQLQSGPLRRCSHRRRRLWGLTKGFSELLGLSITMAKVSSVPQTCVTPR